MASQHAQMYELFLTQAAGSHIALPPDCNTSINVTLPVGNVPRLDIAIHRYGKIPSASMTFIKQTDGLYHKELTMHVIHRFLGRAGMHASDGLLGTALHVGQQP